MKKVAESYTNLELGEERNKGEGAKSMVEGIWRCLVVFASIVKYFIMFLVSLLVCLLRLVFG